MRLYVPLNRQEYEALERLAYAERRRPQDQAALLIAQTLADRPAETLPRYETPKDDPEQIHDSLLVTNDVA